MKKLLVSLLCLLLFCSPAVAQSTKAALATEITTNFPDNTTGLITPAILRTTATDFVNSWQQAVTVNAQTGTTYTIAVGDYGKLVTFSNGGAIAVTLPQATGSFSTFNVYVRNLGVGTVTITPTTSTVNAAATLVLTTGQAAWIVSDGANYQTWINGTLSTIPVSGGGTGQTTALAARGASGLDIDSCTSTGDANYTILATDRCVYHTALSAARTDILPAANAVNAGQVLVVTDFRGVATAANTITIQRAGADTINGAATSVAINLAYGAAIFWSDGSSRWTFFPAGASGAGTVTSVATAGIVTGGPITTSGTVNVNATIKPQGRLTLTTATPVLTSSVSGATTVYYTPYVGNLVPLYDGTNMVPTAFAEVSQATTDTTKSPAAVAASSVYDVFCWVDSGTNRCTRGPVWTNSSTRSAGTALTRVNGIWLNNASITNGPAASRGTYVGTIASNGSSQIDYIFGATSSGGTAGAHNVWNAYNRVNVGSTVSDSSAGHSYTSAVIRQWGGATGMQVSFVVGLAEESVSATMNSQLGAIAALSATLYIGVGYDSTTTFSARTYYDNPVATATFGFANIEFTTIPAIGTHIFSANEAGDSTNANNFGGNTYNSFVAKLKM